ncbi:ThiF family adenylyltransferase [Vibrio sp. HN007]|uniref:HesA/MoeB/ThiF family protein n=1 Tax=Vibrio iocasae TaxID=3098914 RepID=UPI0035D468D7
MSNCLSELHYRRYERQVSLVEVGDIGQETLLRSNILVIGCGGLGTAASTFLAGAGIGKLVLADGDRIDESNLHRQLPYKESDISYYKTSILKSYLEERNRHIKIRTVENDLEGEQLELEVMMADVVLDCTDSFQSRYAINHACVKNKTVLISGSAIGWNGQIISALNGHASQPCYHCLFPDFQDAEFENCSSRGVLGPVVGVIGNMQALQAIKHLLGLETEVETRLLTFDGKSLNWESMKGIKNVSCTVCGSGKQRDMK